jgi:hypothetical protein
MIGLPESQDGYKENRNVKGKGKRGGPLEARSSHLRLTFGSVIMPSFSIPASFISPMTSTTNP